MYASLGVSVLAMMVLPATTQQDAQSILATVYDMQTERWAEVDNYSVEEHMEGSQLSAPVYYEKTMVGELVTFRRVPLNEWMQEGTGNEAPPPEMYEAMADASEKMGDAFAEEGGPLSPMVVDMTNDAASFYRMAADAERSGAAYAGEIEDAANVGGLAQFGRLARLVGTETVDGREAFVLRVDEMPEAKFEQPEAEAILLLDAVTAWIDVEHYVLLGLTFEGQLEVDGKRTPVTIERWPRDYSQVGPLYEPERQLVRITGLMEAMATDPKKKKELAKMREEIAKAQKQMDDMEAQIAELDPQTRQMVEGQVEKFRKQMAMMANEGVIEAVIESKVIAYNEGPPVNWMPFGVPPSP